MAWSPEKLAETLREQLREAAIIRDRAEPPKGWRERASRAWRREALWGLRLWRDPVQTGMRLVVVAALAAAANLFISSWPPGGGSSIGSLAAAQGAGLIFVVILMSLLAGPLEASLLLPWGAARIAADWRIWLAFGSIALLSIAELLVAWSDPDRREELATIFLTLSGLALTGLLARRLIRLSDPNAQVAHYLPNVLKSLTRARQRGTTTSSSALSRAGVELAVAAQVVAYPEPETRGMTVSAVRQFTGTARFALARGDRTLAATSHIAATVIVHEYVSGYRAFASDDALLSTFTGETLDLHELSSGASGRWLSQSLTDNLVSVAMVVSPKNAETNSAGTNDALWSVFEGLAEIARRRSVDARSEDAYRAIRGIGAAARSACDAGQVWTVSAAVERILPWAQAGNSIQSMTHLAIAAWEEALAALVQLSSKDAATARLAFHASAQDFWLAIEQLDSLPRFTILSSVEPLLRAASSRPGSLTLSSSFYALWDAREEWVGELAEFGRRLGLQLPRLLDRAVDDHARRVWSEDIADVLYQWTCAVATRLDNADLTPEASAETLGSMVNMLGWMRSLLFGETGTRQELDLPNIFHAYLSGWQVLLYSMRDESGLPTEGAQELERFLSALTEEIAAEMPAVLQDGLIRLAAWLQASGFIHEGDLAQDAASRAPSPAANSWGQPPGWDMVVMGHRDFMTRRGGIIPTIISRVEDHFGDSGSEHA